HHPPSDVTSLGVPRSQGVLLTVSRVVEASAVLSDAAINAVARYSFPFPPGATTAWGFRLRSSSNRDSLLWTRPATGREVCSAPFESPATSYRGWPFPPSAKARKGF